MKFIAAFVGVAIAADASCTSDSQCGATGDGEK